MSDLKSNQDSGSDLKSESEVTDSSSLSALISELSGLVPGGTVSGDLYQAASIRGGKGTAFIYHLTNHAWIDVSEHPFDGQGIDELKCAIANEPPALGTLEKPPAPEEPSSNGVLVYDTPGQSSAAIWNDLGLALSGNGTPYSNVDNMIRIFERVPTYTNLVYFDSFHNKCFTTDNREWSDIDDLNLMATAQRDLGLPRMTDDVISKAIRIYAQRFTRNEPQEWIKSLVWDKTPRLSDFFIDCFGADDNEYTQAVGRNFFVSMVARVFSPGCKVDNMVVLEGKQGKYKSTALEIIGGKWYSEAHDSITRNDFYQALQSKLIVEIADLDSFTRAEVNTIKRAITCRTDRYRAPYGRHVADYPRSSIFVGTTNEDSYLSDSTGARRFWPIKIGTIRHDLVRSNREQYFAEAYALYADNAKWWEVPDSALDVQESRRKTDEWESVIHAFTATLDEVSVLEIALDCLKFDVSGLTRADQLRIGHCLKVIGFERFKRRIGSTSAWRWRRPVGAD